MSNTPVDAPTLNDKAILNATNKNVPEETITMLSLGPKFVLPITKAPQIPVYHLLAGIESVIKTHTSKQIQDKTRCEIVNIMQNFLSAADKNKKQDPTTKFCAAARKSTQEFIKQNPDVCITQSDKGNRTVIMLMEEYDRKMLELLNNSNVYQKLNKDPTSSIERKTNQIVKRLKDLSLIDPKTAYKLQSNTGTCPRIYGQPKAHKPDLPVRPVVPNISSPTYNLSKYMSQILQAAIRSEHNIRDSFTFAAEINELTLPEGYVMVSFDVVSLFTNIPKELVLKGIIENWQDIKKHTNICLDIFLEIIEFCLDTSYFMFRSQFYLQRFGSAMGSSLSPILADMVLNTLVDTVVKQLDFPVPYLKKYVDVFFIALPENSIQSTLDTFNNYNYHLQFTAEIEQQCRLPFLDMVITRRPDQKLVTDWYCKPIASGRIINYYSLHPLKQKVNIASNFIKRVVGLSKLSTIQQQKAIVLDHLRRNNYPKTLINRIFNRIINDHTTDSRVPDPNAPDCQYSYVSLPYVPELCQQISRCLKTDFPTIKIANYSTRIAKSFYTTVKDSVEPMAQHNVIYMIPCNECSGRYIGMTRNKLQTRISGHKSDINKLNSRVELDDTTTDQMNIQIREKTALIEHCVQYGHRFALDKTAVVDRTYNPFVLPLLECFHIYNTPDTVNRRTDVDGISSIYAGILHTVKKYQQPDTTTNSQDPQSRHQDHQQQNSTNTELQPTVQAPN